MIYSRCNTHQERSQTEINRNSHSETGTLACGINQELIRWIIFWSHVNRTGSQQHGITLRDSSITSHDVICMTWKYSPPFTRVATHLEAWNYRRTYTIWAAVPSTRRLVLSAVNSFFFRLWLWSMKCACSCLHSCVRLRVRHRNKLLCCSLMSLANTYLFIFILVYKVGDTKKK